MWRHADVWQPSWQQRQHGQCCWGVNVWGVNWLVVHYVCCQSHHFWSSEMEETRNSTGKDGIGAWMCSNPSNNYYILPIQHGCIEHCFAEFPLRYAPASKLFSGPPMAFLSHRPGEPHYALCLAHKDSQAWCAAPLWKQNAAAEKRSKQLRDF